MSISRSFLRSLIVPGWTRIIPGLLLCVVFAFVVMNIDHLLGKYHKANVASEKLPVIQAKLAQAKAAGSSEKVVRLNKSIAKHTQNLNRVNGKVGDKWSWATLMYQTLQFKYVAMLLIGGILIRNIFGLHPLFLAGVGAARPLIKPGIIILGAHYAWNDVLRVGGIGLLLAGVSIFGTAIAVMWLCQRFKVSNGLGGVMGAGAGVCGVSAIVATSPVVRAKPQEMAYAVGTILFFGTAMLFLMPYMGQALGVSQSEFGAWVALAILNTAQLVAAAEWYGEEARNTAVLITAARIMLIPWIVVFAVWFYGLKKKGSNISFFQTIRAKFPVFILGFFILIILNSLNLAGLGGPKMSGSPLWAMDAVYKWFFAVGFAGIGLSISIGDMKKAGGLAFFIGSGASVFKMVFSFLAVMFIGAELLRVIGG